MEGLTRLLLAVVVGLCGVLATGCRPGPPDDESARPTITRTASPTPPLRLPDLPVGRAALHPGDQVRVEGMAFLVGKRRIELAPLRIDEFAVVPGGIFFRNQTELWFTDLVRARPTPFDDIRDLGSQGTTLRFTDLDHGAPDASGNRRPVRVEYDARTGHFLSARYVGAH